MFIVRTSYTNVNGTGKIVAKGHGKQRTVNYNPAMSSEWNHGAAAGTLLNVLLSPEQQAKVRHPSGHQRVEHDSNDSGTKHGFKVNV